MMRQCIVVALLAASFFAANAGGSTYHESGSRTADMDFLMKQKKIYDLLGYVDQNFLRDSEYFEIGRSYDIAANLDYYTNQNAIMEYIEYYKMGLSLSRDALFTYYNEDHRYEMMMLYRMMYFAKDFATFYKTACWARLHLNSGMFVAAFTSAVAYRNDTRYIRLPAIYEIYPPMFFSARAISSAYRLKMSRASGGYSYRDYELGSMRHGGAVAGDYESSAAPETYYLYSNTSEPGYSYYYYDYPESGSDYRLGYFMQDVGLNSYYYYFRMAYPYWMNLKEYSLASNFRGDFYYFWHKQLMARYNLERYANGLDEIDYMSWDRVNMPGYYSDISYGNGISMPSRDWWNVVPYYKYKYVEYIEKLETRIMEAIDSGYFYDESGKQISLYGPEGLNYLGNLIEGNYDSYNLKYYGSYDALARNIFCMNPSYNKNWYIPSPLQLFSTSLRDPAFYRIYDKILYFFRRYKENLNRYTKSELEFPGVKIENVEMGKLVTYWDRKDYLLNHAVAVDSYKEGKSFNIKYWQQYLNYKPFTYKFTMSSDKDTRGIVRIFLGPAYEGQSYDGYYSYFQKYYKYFFMLDEFDISLKPGTNTYERQSTQSSLFYNYNNLDSDYYYRKIVKAIEGNEPFTYKESMYGFPSNLMLPKGSPEGMKYQMFFYVAPYEEAKTYEMPFFGKLNFYGKSFGYPIDRPMYPWFFQLDNVFFKDAYIYHMPSDYSKDMPTGKYYRTNY